MIFYTFYHSPLGKITLISNEQFLIGLYFEKQKNYPTLSEMEELDNSVFVQTKKWLDEYFCGKNPALLNFLQPKGSKFSERIWKLLLNIPYGETVTYGEVAEQYFQEFNKKTSARAVGRAVGSNPIGIIIPCHRVIGANGKLTGYAGGLENKIELLKLERKVVDKKMRIFY